MPSRYELSNAVIVANEESKQKIEEASKKGNLYEVIAEEIYAWVDKGAPPEIKNNIKNGIFGGLDVVEMKYEREQQVKKQLKKGNLRDITDQEIETWLNDGGNPNRKNKKGVSVLCQCIGRNNENLVKKCLENGGNPNKQYKDRKHIDLLSEACALDPLSQGLFSIWGLISCFATFYSVSVVGFGIDLLTGKLTPQNEGPFFSVTMVLGMIASICSISLNTDGWYYFHRTPLMKAAQNDNENIIKMLLEKGANPCVRSDDGYTAVKLAYNDPCRKLIQNAMDTWEQKSKPEHSKEVLSNIVYVLGKGVKIAFNVFNKICLLPFKVAYCAVKGLAKGAIWVAKTVSNAAQKAMIFPFKATYHSAQKMANDIEIVRQNLEARKARDRIKDFNFKKGSLADFKKLIVHGASVNSLDKNGSPILVSAASEGRTDIVQYLLDNNAWINARNQNDEHALMVAVKNGHIDTIDLLIKRKDVDLRIINKDGLNLFGVVQDGDYNTKEFLKTILPPKTSFELLQKTSFDFAIADFARSYRTEHPVPVDGARADITPQVQRDLVQQSR